MECVEQRSRTKDKYYDYPHYNTNVLMEKSLNRLFSISYMLDAIHLCEYTLVLQFAVVTMDCQAQPYKLYQPESRKTKKQIIR